MFPRWFKWLFIAFLGYLLFLGNTQHPAPQKPQKPAIEAEKTYPAIEALTSADQWKRKLDPEYAARTKCKVDLPKDGFPIKVFVDREGKGPGMQCGETQSLTVTIWSSDGKVAYENSFDVTLGHQDIAAGLDEALLGIKLGEARTIILPPAALTHSKESKAPKSVFAALAQKKVAVVTVARNRDEP